jgi:hypothetical protein
VNEILRRFDDEIRETALADIREVIDLQIDELTELLRFDPHLDWTTCTDRELEAAADCLRVTSQVPGAIEYLEHNKATTHIRMQARLVALLRAANPAAPEAFAASELAQIHLELEGRKPADRSRD